MRTNGQITEEQRKKMLAESTEMVDKLGGNISEAQR